MFTSNACVCVFCLLIIKYVILGILLGNKIIDNVVMWIKWKIINFGLVTVMSGHITPPHHWLLFYNSTRLTYKPLFCTSPPKSPLEHICK